MPVNLLGVLVAAACGVLLALALDANPVAGAAVAALVWVAVSLLLWRLRHERT